MPNGLSVFKTCETSARGRGSLACLRHQLSAGCAAISGTRDKRESAPQSVKTHKKKSKYKYEHENQQEQQQQQQSVNEFFHTNWNWKWNVR